MTYLAVAVSTPDTESALAALHQVARWVDLAELRLDLMQSFDLQRLLDERPLPVIVTCRPTREGGRWRGSEAERLAVLRQASILGADYVDLEWDVAAASATLDRSRTQVILSRHDFTRMPADLRVQADRLWTAGADIVKIVGMAQHLAESLPILRLLNDAVRPTIAIAMGDHGLVTRLLAFRYPHSFLSFAALDDASPQSDSLGIELANKGTAPGQITVRGMREVYRVSSISASTKLLGLMQPRANASRLIVAGNAWLAEHARDTLLVPLDLADGESEAQVRPALAETTPFMAILTPDADTGKIRCTALATDERRTFDSIDDALQWTVRLTESAGH